MASIWSIGEMDYVQEDNDEEMDGETCFAFCQDSDSDGSEFKGCKVALMIF